MSVPRLELMAAKLLAQMTKTVTEVLKNQIEVTSINLWSDSMTTLCWIANKKEWKQYVKNRVNEILKKKKIKLWKYCPGNQNPADVGTRGIKASNLRESELWWRGRDWIVNSERWPGVDKLEETEERLVEQRKDNKVKSFVTVVNQDNLLNVIDVAWCGSIEKTSRVTAYVLRFVKNLKSKKSKAEKVFGRLTVGKLNNAEEY